MPSTSKEFEKKDLRPKRDNEDSSDHDSEEDYLDE